jgi:hypothetical protein
VRGAQELKAKADRHGVSVKRFYFSDSKKKEEREFSKPKFNDRITDFIFILQFPA